MSHEIVKIKVDDNGEKRLYAKWHWITDQAGVLRTLCDGEAFGIGDSGAVYETKIVKKGGVTCSECLRLIKMFKSIKL